MKNKRCVICVSLDTYKALCSAKVENESFDTVIRRLMGKQSISTRSNKYKMLEVLGIGENVLIPWRLNEDGNTSDQSHLQQAVWRAERKTGRRFSMTGTPMGLKVTRIR